jgi:hypothetical protein
LDAPLDRLELFDDLGPAPGGFTPTVDLEVLHRLNVPVHAMDEIVGMTPTRDEHPEAWWLLDRLYHTLTLEDGLATPPPWPAPFATSDPLTHHFHLYVFLAAISHVLQLHAKRGIAADITWATLEDVGLQVANYEVRHGRPGFDGAFWVWPHFRCEALTIGRLQFDRRYVPIDAAGGLEPHRGEPALGVHIPALGPLDADACDASLAQAREFYATHFPEERYEVGICESWLMDEQLAEYLPDGSNIRQFQERFTLGDDWTRLADDDVIRFVFGRLPADLDDLPQETTLQRAAVGHLQAGRHWYFRRGWLAL